MNHKPFLDGIAVPSARRLALTLMVLSALVTACGGGTRTVGSGGDITATQATESGAGGTLPPANDTSPTTPAAQTSNRTVTNVSMGFCFVYPEGFTQQTNDGFVEVVGPFSGSGPEPGLGWVVATDSQGRTALDVANEEVKAVEGLNPGRSTVMLGGEEAVVLDGMPGQDLVRKAYIVHEGKLYTLSFSPYHSENLSANAQMEALYASVTSSWEWISSGRACPAGN